MMKPTNFDSSSQKEHRTPGILLTQNYQPSLHTVIVGRGREPKQNMGNKRLQVLAQSFLKKYREGDKKCKTQIVSNIICMIRDACKGGKGAFVKHTNNGQWYELDNSVAREKVGYVVRDLLADEYKSSSKSKVARRHHPMSYFPQSESSPSTTEHHHQQQQQQQQHSTMLRSDDDTVSTVESTNYGGHDSFRATTCHDVSDILIRSTAFLDNNEAGADDITPFGC
jgi:hypothetical protein